MTASITRLSPPPSDPAAPIVLAGLAALPGDANAQALLGELRGAQADIAGLLSRAERTAEDHALAQAVELANAQSGPGVYGTAEILAQLRAAREAELAKTLDGLAASIEHALRSANRALAQGQRLVAGAPRVSAPAVAWVATVRREMTALSRTAIEAHGGKLAAALVGLADAAREEDLWRYRLHICALASECFARQKTTKNLEQQDTFRREGASLLALTRQQEPNLHPNEIAGIAEQVRGLLA